MVLLGYTDDGIIAVLGAQGFKTSAGSVRRRLQAWGIRRDENGQITDELVEAVNWAFHHTLLNDTQIVVRVLTDYDLRTTGR